MAEEEKAPFVRGLRHLPDKRLDSIGAAGRNIEQQIDDIRKEGVIFTPQVFRNSIIGGLEIRKWRGKAENVFIIGCGCFGTALLLRSSCLLMQKLGVKYVFLEKEYCCGAPLLHQVLHQGQDRAPIDEACREFTELNISLSRAKGAQNVVYLCSWCLYLAKRFFPSEPGLLFYLDVIAQHIGEVKLRLSGRVGYFGGTSHRKAVYDPDETYDMDWDQCLKMLKKVEGLEVVEIPRYCCQIKPELIFDKARKEGLEEIVVSCVVCYGRLMRIAPPEITIKFLTDVLLEAAVIESPATAGN